MKPFVTLAAALLLTACASTGTANEMVKEATAQDAEQAIAAAESARKQAAALKYEWRDTGKMIKQAQELAKEGKFVDAVNKARMAQRQGEMATQQAKAEAELTRTR